MAWVIVNGFKSFKLNDDKKYFCEHSWVNHVLAINQNSWKQTCSTDKGKDWLKTVQTTASPQPIKMKWVRLCY